jgi:hypothetical protein
MNQNGAQRAHKLRPRCIGAARSQTQLPINQSICINTTSAGGDERDEFFIGHDKGNVLLAKQLDWERQREYNLTISVTDRVHTIYTQVSGEMVLINIIIL